MARLYVCIRLPEDLNVQLGLTNFHQAGKRDTQSRQQPCLEIKYDCFNPPLQ